jgi:hypothetical protein
MDTEIIGRSGRDDRRRDMWRSGADIEVPLERHHRAGCLDPGKLRTAAMALSRRAMMTASHRRP